MEEGEVIKRRVGAALLLEMDLESLVTCTIAWYAEHFRNIIAEEAARVKVDWWVPMGRQIAVNKRVAELFTGFVESIRSAAVRRYNERVTRWGGWNLQRTGGSTEELVYNLLARIADGTCECIAEEEAEAA